MNTKKVIIIHGWETDPSCNWFPWLKAELEKIGCEAIVPEMSNTNHPQMTEWLNYLDEVVGGINENTYFVGHSLGVITALRYLERQSFDTKVGGAVLVAGFPDVIGYPALDNFFVTPLDFGKVKNKAKKFVVIHSDNDQHVPLMCGDIFQDKLEAELIVINNGGHLNDGDRSFGFPLVLEKLKEMF